MKNAIFTLITFALMSFTNEKTVRVKLVNNCSYDVSVSCSGYSLMVSKNSYLTTDLPTGTEIALKKYGESSGFDKLYLEEKDAQREIIVCK